MGKISKYIDEGVTSITVADLIKGLHEGDISVPHFQRQFVWTLDKSAALLDSILKGYPAGALTLWYSKEELRDVRKVGNTTIRQSGAPEGGRYYNYIIDGQQRALTLYACLRGSDGVAAKHVASDTNEENKEEKYDYSKIYVDLAADLEGEAVVVTEKEKKEREEKEENGRGENSFVSIKDLYKMNLARMKELGDYGDNANDYKGQLDNYVFSRIQIKKEATIDIATEIFTRINTTGKKLDLFEIMVAKTYKQRKFDLFEEHQKFESKLEKLGYGNLPRDLVLRVAAALIDGKYGEKDILKLDKKEFRNRWGDVCDAIERSVGFFKNHYRIKASSLLPYSKQITTLFAYFFGKMGKNSVSDDQKGYLKDFFWRCVLSERYSHSSSSKVVHDMKRMMGAILGVDKEGKIDTSSSAAPIYQDKSWMVNFRPSVIKGNKGLFSPKSNDYIKAILCIYANKNPVDFGDKKLVSVENRYLQRADSRNYHHFFPRGYMKNKSTEYEVNHVLNITLITEGKNKEIGDKAPNKYMSEASTSLAKAAPGTTIEEVMKTHLIGEGCDDFLSDWGIKDNNYNLFIEKRADLLIKEIRNLINFTEDLDID